MNAVENRIRAATRAAGDTVREVRRPLRLDRFDPGADGAAGPGPGIRVRRARHWKAWMAPVTAAAAVLAIGVALVIVRDLPNGRVVPPRGPVPGSGVPAYYAAIAEPTGWYAYAPLSGAKAPAARLVIGETFTGRRLATVAPPRGATFMGVTAAADDRTFVVDTAPLSAPSTDGSDVPSAAARWWYLLSFHPGGTHAARLTRLPIPATPNGTLIFGIAVSPDGTKLAVAQASKASAAHGTEFVRIYSVRTGAVLFTWSAPIQGYSNLVPRQGPDNNATLFWTSDGRGLAWEYVSSASPGGGIDNQLLEVPFPGHRLYDYADASGAIRGCSPNGGLLVVADGSTVVCAPEGVLRDWGPRSGDAACPVGPSRTDLGVLEFPATGGLSRTLHAIGTNCAAGTGLAGMLWASASGDQVIGWVNAPPKLAGRPYAFTSAGYLPLPSFPAGVVFGGVAW